MPITKYQSGKKKKSIHSYAFMQQFQWFVSVLPILYQHISHDDQNEAAW